ncbi:hypothetical protein HMSSN139_01690 [Paenibacillus sp. HMSSN-139]|nr:hypothetical protein HMSSN139_01690 [Paenibacillus sp. HMSSN-139]
MFGTGDSYRYRHGAETASRPTAHGSGYKKRDLLTVNREKGKYRVENRVERAQSNNPQKSVAFQFLRLPHEDSLLYFSLAKQIVNNLCLT